jgi:transcriptional regulator with PAS, ATPase and Fis domain
MITKDPPIYRTGESSSVISKNESDVKSEMPTWQQRANELIKIIGVEHNTNYKSQLIRAARYSIYTDIVFLMLGETGVGKSFLAFELHKISGRTGRFIDYNCAKAQTGKLYQEIFGWTKGSFTGSIKEHIGKIGLADKGTLFLDEAHAMSSDVIDELKTFFDKREYWQLGAETFKKANLSIILATNKNPRRLVGDKIWPYDFYRRVNNVVIAIPPLRDMKQDFPIIVNKIVDEFNEKHKVKIDIEPSAVDYLKGFGWPSNIAQLKDYLRIKFLDVKDLEEFRIKVINKEILIQDPPDCEIIESNTENYNLEEIFLQLMQNWKLGDKNILKNHILPVIAKVYRQDFKPNMSYKEKETKANSIIGLGGGGERSKLWQMQKEYENLSKRNST